MLALALSVLLGAAAVAAANTGGGHSDIVPAGTTSVVVVDLSRSVVDDDLATVGATLRRLIASDTPTGLVVFSDVAYEMLPPGSSPSALVPLLRYFTPARGVFPANPWQATFRAGTRISGALELAREMLVRRDLRDGSIVLISDLETAPSDFATLTQTLTELQREKVALRVIPLRPTERGRDLFGSLLGQGAILPSPSEGVTLGARVQRRFEGDLPVALLLLCGLLLLGLAANERWCARLALPTEPRERGS